jgi:hypothetical protein
MLPPDRCRSEPVSATPIASEGPGSTAGLHGSDALGLGALPALPMGSLPDTGWRGRGLRSSIAERTDRHVQPAG